jgi:hypothetical protein
VADLRPRDDVALALAISDDLTPDVKRYIASTGMDISVITIYLPTGISNTSITGCDHAYAVALAVRDLAREIARTVNPQVLHLIHSPRPPGSPSCLAACAIACPRPRLTKICAATGTNRRS